ASPPTPRALLLEGACPAEWRKAGLQSLDETIDATYGWIDRRAVMLTGQLIELAAEHGAPCIDALALPLRYALVRLLRVVTYFNEVAASDGSASWHAHL